MYLLFATYAKLKYKKNHGRNENPNFKIIN